MVGLTKLSLKN